MSRNYIKLNPYNNKNNTEKAWENRNVKELNLNRATMYIKEKEKNEVVTKRKAIIELIQKKLRQYYNEFEEMGYSDFELRNKVCINVYNEINEEYEKLHNGTDALSTIVYFAKKMGIAKNKKSQDPQWTEQRTLIDEDDFENR